MRTIKAFNLSPLHVEEDFGFLKQFHDEAVTLRGGSGGDSESPDEIADEVNPVLDGQISAFETKLDAFDEALKSSSSLPSTALATDADVERDSAWRGANAYVKAMTEHPDVATATAARTVIEKQISVAIIVGLADTCTITAFSAIAATAATATSVIVRSIKRC